MDSDHPHDEGMLRPEPVVLGAEALVPDDNVAPAPTRLTHELTEDEPYWFDRTAGGDADGMLPAGTPVAVAHDGAELTTVIDRRGLSVEVRTASLRPAR